MSPQRINLVKHKPAQQYNNNLPNNAQPQQFQIVNHSQHFKNHIGSSVEMGTNKKLQNRLRSGSKNLDNRNPVLNEDEEDDDNAVYEQDEFEPIDH